MSAIDMRVFDESAHNAFISLGFSGRHAFWFRKITDFRCFTLKQAPDPSFLVDAVELPCLPIKRYLSYCPDTDTLKPLHRMNWRTWKNRYANLFVTRLLPGGEHNPNPLLIQKLQRVRIPKAMTTFSTGRTEIRQSRSLGQRRSPYHRRKAKS